MMNESEIKRLKSVYAHYAQTEHPTWQLANKGNALMWQEQLDASLNLLKTQASLPLSQLRILDIGCGHGELLAGFAQAGANPDQLYGVDLLPERIEFSQQHYPDMHWQQADASQLAFADGYFDVIQFSTVFSSILDETMRQAVVTEAHRILKKNGAILWYDLRYPSPMNRHVRAFSAIQLQALFSGWDCQLQSLTVLPPLSRRLGGCAKYCYPWLARLPWLRSHYLAWIIKNNPAR